MPSSWAAPAGAFRRATGQSPALSPEMKVARRSRDGRGAVAGLIYRQLWRNQYCLHTSPAPSGHPPQRGGHIFKLQFAPQYRSRGPMAVSLFDAVGDELSAGTARQTTIYCCGAKNPPEVICTPNTGHPVLGVFSCGIVMSLS